MFNAAKLTQKDKLQKAGFNDIKNAKPFFDVVRDSEIKELSKGYKIEMLTDIQIVAVQWWYLLSNTTLINILSSHYFTSLLLIHKTKNMKKHIFKLVGVPAFLISFSYFGCYIKANEFPNTNKVPVAVEYFKAGEVLLPDYACCDTLVVNDASGLNVAMGYIEQGIIDGTDDSIDSTFHLYCSVK